MVTALRLRRTASSCRFEVESTALGGRRVPAPVPQADLVRFPGEALESACGIQLEHSRDQRASDGIDVDPMGARLPRAAAAFQLGLGDARLPRVRRDRLPSGTRSSSSGISLNSSNH